MLLHFDRPKNSNQPPNEPAAPTHTENDTYDRAMKALLVVRNDGIRKLNDRAMEEEFSRELEEVKASYALLRDSEIPLEDLVERLALVYASIYKHNAKTLCQIPAEYEHGIKSMQVIDMVEFRTKSDTGMGKIGFNLERAERIHPDTTNSLLPGLPGYQLSLVPVFWRSDDPKFSDSEMEKLFQKSRQRAREIQ